MQTRLLGPSDVHLAEEACRVFGRAGAVDPSAFLSRAEAALFVTREGSTVVGWVYGHELVHPDGERTMLLYALDVAEGARRRGVGTALVRAFVAHARGRGCTEVWVLTDDSNPAGLATYRSAGGNRDATPQVMFTWTISD